MVVWHLNNSSTGALLLNTLGGTDAANWGNGSSIPTEQARRLPCSLCVLHAVLLFHLWTDGAHLQPASEPSIETV